MTTVIKIRNSMVDSVEGNTDTVEIVEHDDFARDEDDLCRCEMMEEPHFHQTHEPQEKPTDLPGQLVKALGELGQIQQAASNLLLALKDEEIFYELTKSAIQELEELVKD